MKTPYIRFIDLRDQFIVPFDLTAGSLLDLIASCAESQPLTVMGCMNCGLASPATLHRKLDDLMCFGYIEHKMKDKRTKYVVPTEKANKYFESLSAAIKVAAMGTTK